jgi:hypothetical protein
MAEQGVDATVQAGLRGGQVMFSREADDAGQAIGPASADVEAAGMTVSGVTGDLVMTDEIAQRARVTATSVRYWITGARGPGSFPEPAVKRQRGSLFSWAEVSTWLAA